MAHPNITREELVESGWTTAHIKRLLGEPLDDGTWPAELVLSAEINDEKVQARLERVADRNTKKAREAKHKEDAKQRAIKRWKVKQAEDHNRQMEELAKDHCIFRKIGGEWLVQGEGLSEGDFVEVRKANGEYTDVIIDEVLPDGMARFSPITRKNIPLLADLYRVIGRLAKAAYGQTAFVVPESADYEFPEPVKLPDSFAVRSCDYRPVDVIARSESRSFVVVLAENKEKN